MALHAWSVSLGGKKEPAFINQQASNEIARGVEVGGETLVVCTSCVATVGNIPS